MQPKSKFIFMALMLMLLIPNMTTVTVKASALDYANIKNWIINDKAVQGKSYDLIFFIGTSVIDQTQDNGVSAPSEDMRQSGYFNYIACGSELAENARVFCPLQHQIALKPIMQYNSHDRLIDEIAEKEPYQDLKAALDYYFSHYNKEGQRPFVIAGHSQGGAAVQVVLNKYFLQSDKRDYLKNMVAAYSIGYGVAEKHFAAWPNKEGRLHFALGPADFNCLISWNTEGIGPKGKNILLADERDTTLVINPLNWQRDESYASIKENQGILQSSIDAAGKKTYHLSFQQQDLLDAKIDLQRGSVLCSTTQDFVSLPPKIADNTEIWGGKSLHFYDGKGYYNNTKSNLQIRLNEFLKDRNLSQLPHSLD